MTSKERYSEMVKQASPGSTVVKDCLLAFLFGGLVCTFGQALFNVYTNFGLPLKEARTAVSFTLILISAAMTMIGVYDQVGKHAGAGLIVPITGFANSMVAAGIEFKSEGLIMGVGAKLFTIAGPVIVYGLTASVVYGIVLYIMQML